MYDKSGVETDHLRALEMMESLERLSQLERQVADQTQQLYAYHNLPADRNLARLAVEQKRLEYAELEEKRQALLGAMAGVV